MSTILFGQGPPDGRELILDRLREESDIVLLDLPPC